MLVEKFY